MDKRLILHLNDKDSTQIELVSFEYQANRMSGAPTLTSTLKHFSKLDINTDCYTEFKGEKFYVKQTPSITQSNTDARYKYEITFVSERDILDNIYFYDASNTDNSAEKRLSHNTKFVFSGDIYSYVSKLNASLKKYGYSVVIDDGVTVDGTKACEAKTFENVYISAALQEIYNIFELPYYFEGKVIHVGFQSTSIDDDTVFEYGVDKSLISVNKANANYKVVNKCTAVGSSDNIPYYYPNKTPYGDVSFTTDGVNVIGISYERLGKYVSFNEPTTLTFHKKPEKAYDSYQFGCTLYESRDGRTTLIQSLNATNFTETLEFRSSNGKSYTFVDFILQTHANEKIDLLVSVGCQIRVDSTRLEPIAKDDVSLFLDGVYLGGAKVAAEFFDDNRVRFTATQDEGTQYTVRFKVCIEYDEMRRIPVNTSFSINPLRLVHKDAYFTISGSDKEIEVSASGVNVAYTLDPDTRERIYAAKELGEVYVSAARNLMPSQSNLMPPIYRGTYGAERFYEAKNENYTVTSKDDSGASVSYTVDYDGIVFDNPYDLTTRNYREHSFTVDDLKPKLEASVVDIAFDSDDNNDFDDDNKYKHPCFFVKLPALGFNLFDHASENGEMILSFTSGRCSSCQFPIMVGTESLKNTVQVDDFGNLEYDEKGNVKFGDPQLEQNNTSSNSVWIALQKEDKTYGTLFPDTEKGEVPQSGDTFVLLNINLPFSYIEAAEAKLEQKIIDYLYENNQEKFNFDIKFSRIFLAENEEIRNKLNENSSINLRYFKAKHDSEVDDKDVRLYVTAFNYKMKEGEALPEISVSLADKLSTKQSAMQNVVNKVKGEVLNDIAAIDVVAQGARAFIRKDTDDQTPYSITAQEVNVVDKVKVGKNLDVLGELHVDRKSDFKDSIKVDGDLTIGNYKEVLGEITGGKINQDGHAAFKSIRANQFEIFTLIYNKINASSSFEVLDDAGTVIELAELGRGSYKITFDKTKCYGYSNQPFVENDILHSYVNEMNDYGYSIGGECWLKVVSVEADGDPYSIIASMYADEDIPSGTNIRPTRDMVLVHRGNSTVKERQNTFYISTSDGNIIQLLDVTSPILYDPRVAAEDGKHYSNYGNIYGKFPSDLLEYLSTQGVVLNPNHPYIYTRGIVAQDFYQLDYLGRPIKTERYRGQWNASTANGDDPYRSFRATDVSYYDTVTYNGSKWQCDTDKSKLAPTKTGEGATHWTEIVSKGEKGDDGGSLRIVKKYDDLDSFKAEHMLDGKWIAPQNISDCYIVGAELYVWFPENNGEDAYWGSVGDFRGTNGESPIVADIDEDTDSVGLTYEGVTLEAYSKTITLRMWEGLKAVDFTVTQIESPAFLHVGDSSSLSDGGVQYPLTIQKGTSVPSNSVVKFTLLHGDVERNVTFTLSGVRAGAKGESPVLYRVIPSVNQIVRTSIIRNGVEEIVDYPNVITATCTKTVGDKTETFTDGTLTCEIDNGGGIQYPSSGIQSSEINRNIKFKLSVDGKLVDSETVSVVMDGTDGNHGEDSVTISLDNDRDSMLYLKGSNILISSTVVSTATLKEGNVDITHSTNVTWSQIAYGCTLFNAETANTNVIKVIAINDNVVNAYVEITANYKGTEYKKRFTIEKKFGAEKFSVVCNPSSLSVNLSYGWENPKFEIHVYREAQTSTGIIESSEILPSQFSEYGLSLFVNDVELALPEEGVIEIPFVQNTLLYHVDLKRDNNTEDSQDVTLSLTRNGLSFTDSESDYAVNNSYTEYPREESSWYDTYEQVSTFLEEGKILWVRTRYVLEDGGVTGYSYSATRIGANFSIWDLEFNTLVISVTDRTKPVTQYLDVKVHKTTSAGVITYTDSTELAEKENCKMVYSVDESNVWVDFDLYDGDDLLFDDGSTISMENGNIVNENTIVDVSKIRSHIWVALIDKGTNEIKVREQIKVYNPNYAITIEYDKPSFNVYVDAEKGVVIKTNGTTEDNTFRIKCGGETKELKFFEYEVVSSKGGHDGIWVEENDSTSFFVSLDVIEGMSRDKLPTYVKVTARWKSEYVGGLDINTTVTIPVVFHERGFTGKMGQDGAMIFPYGTWDANAIEASDPYLAYKLVTKVVEGETVIVARPMVYYSPNNDDKGVYYILEKDIPYSLNSNYEPTAPEVSDYWKSVTDYKYIFTEALFAQFAKLAHAIVYGKYMFSKDGSVDGIPRSFDNVGEVDKIFSYFTNDKGEEDYTFNPSVFMPNLYLDFDSGKFYGKDVEITGKVEATSGSFTGTVHATDGEFEGDITATGGTIGGYTIGEKELYTGSNNDETAIDQAILSTDRVRIQHTIEGSGNYRVSFGKNSNPSSQGDAITTVGYIKKYSDTTKVSDRYMPAMRIDSEMKISENERTNGVALATTGAIVSTGGQVEIGRVIKSAGDYSKRYHDWRIEEGSRLCVRNLRDTGSYTYTIYLPSSESIRKFLGTNDYNYVVSLKLIVSMDNTDSGSPTIVLKPEVNDAESSLRKMIFNGVSLEEPQITLSAGKVYDIEFMSFLADGQGSEGNVSIDWIVNG